MAPDFESGSEQKLT